jgi:tetratricopeptide (TPR) repeat protein
VENEKIAEALKLMNKAAMMEIAQGNYENALEIFKQNSILEEKLGLKVQIAESLINAANVYYLMKDYDTAHDKLTRALEIFKRERVASGSFRACQMMGEVCFSKKSFDNAAKYFEECIRMNLGGKETALSYFQAAVTYIKLNNYYKAQEYLNRSLMEFERQNDKTGIVDCLRQRSFLFKLMNRKDLAVRDLNRAMTFVDKNGELEAEIKKSLEDFK